MKPLIAIIGSPWSESLSAGRAHIKRVIEAGGLPAVFSPEIEPEDIIEVADGILLIEGPDVHPRFYGEDPSPSLREVDVLRDEFEIELVKLAVEAGIPILGVGRGMHVINVALGGTLYQDIYDIPKAIKHDWSFGSTRPEQRLHTIRIKADSTLYSILRESLNIEGTNEGWAWVNSFHHQAVKRVGEGLRQVAFAVDGLIEAIEGKEGFVLGVQWQPEHLPEMLPLYRALVGASLKRHEESDEMRRRAIEAEIREELAKEQDESHHSSETSDNPPDTNQT
ncbi:gamma-glutamyl-gamma-aminobutyrate hydrolase family protein [Thermococcus nautili]|uniref:Putative glutamine amidotransferase n=1 Tax=Thermococcus nautili TaxID=195522 RepID=W8NVN3_9EURY|nr:gamma-glutamyl-gamma-aminobutyrate hydrolase family protein [Thermococcus nautili]AHL23338.1 putative glutamine amidotransferase [Thermococcus nautili]